MNVRVVRIYHGGRSRAHRARERALLGAGVDVTLIVPAHWPEGGGETQLSGEPFRIIELPVVRAGDVNRHRYADADALRLAIQSAAPELVDVHEEPFSAVSRQILGCLSPDLPVVMYTAQNVDKRYPPPFTQLERQAFSRVTAMYPCSRQAASVARGRGFAGLIQVIPLGHDPTIFYAGSQRHGESPFRLALVSRLVPEKGVDAAVAALRTSRTLRSAELVLAGDGPEAQRVGALAKEMSVPSEAVRRVAWLETVDVAELYRRSHVVLAPSRATDRWVEQFGRMIPEAQAAGAVVVGYASGAIPEVASGSAWLSPEGDSTGMSRAAADLAQRDSVWTELRDLGFGNAARMTWRRVAEEQAALYRAAAASGPAHRRRVIPAREAARRDFGASARLASGQRPLALPLLRRLRSRNLVAPPAQLRESQGDGSAM